MIWYWYYGNIIEKNPALKNHHRIDGISINNKTKLCINKIKSKIYIVALLSTRICIYSNLQCESTEVWTRTAVACNKKKLYKLLYFILTFVAFEWAVHNIHL